MSEVFYRIVVPTDFSAGSEEAWALAQRLAKALSSELVLVHVFVEAPLWGEGPFTMEHTRSVFAEARKWVIEQLEQRVQQAAAGGLRARAVLREGGAAHDEIVALATDEHADLIAMGTHGRGGLNRMLLGSVTDRVVRLAPCPVLTVRQPE
jgi:nucleotide-binding universal stress UspA family protein